MPVAISACDVAETTGSGYPAPHDVWSSQRHWHALNGGKAMPVTPGAGYRHKDGKPFETPAVPAHSNESSSRT